MTMDMDMRMITNQEIWILPKKDSKNQKKRIGIKETLAGADTLLMENTIQRYRSQAPMERLL